MSREAPSVVQATDQDNKNIRLWYLYKAVHLTAAKIVLTKELRDLNRDQLEPILNILWEDLAHTLLKRTFYVYSCGETCFISLHEDERHKMFVGEHWSRKNFIGAVLIEIESMRYFADNYFQNIYK